MSFVDLVSLGEVMLRLDPDAGHGGGGRDQIVQSVADTYAFILWNVGEAGFRPTAA